MSYIGNQPFNASFVTDTFSGTGSQLTYTLTIGPGSGNAILVVISGVLQPPSAYSVSGQILTFSSAPPTGTNNIVVRYLSLPASSVTNTAYRNYSEFTASAGQTTFNPGSYTPGFIDVFRNGVRLYTTDYTATNGTTVVLANAANSGDSIAVVSFYVSSVLNAIPNTAGVIGVNLLDVTAQGGTGLMILPTGTTAQRQSVSTSTGAIRYNTSLSQLELYTGSTWGAVFQSTLGTFSNPASSGPALYSALGAGGGNGLYWFKNSIGQVQQCYCDLAAGGWVLVSSNDARDTTIPGGTLRYSTAYFLNRSGAGGTPLGLPNPDYDYIIGGFLDNFTFGNVRILGWGRNSLNGTYTYANRTSSTYIDYQWPLTTTGNGRYSEVVLRANVSFGGNSAPYSAANYFVLDGIYVDYINGGFTANSNQTTIGASGNAGSNGDPTNGCYTGHGATEGSFEGWYSTDATNQDCQGYSTWVK